MRSGSIGTTRSGKYTELPRVKSITVQRRARPHIKRDVGNRDMDDVAALVVRIGVGRGMHRVVMILGVGRIDGDERQFAPVLAAFQTGRLRVLGFAHARSAKTLAEFHGRGSRSG